MSNMKNGKWYLLIGGFVTLAIVVAVVAGAIPTTAAPSAQPGQSSLPRTITVVGSGSASAMPDVATAQIGVDTQAASPEEATKNNDAQLRAVIDAIKAAGIDEKDIQTAYYNLYADQRYDPATNQPTGVFTYRVSASLSVKVRDLAKVGAVLGDAVKAGANNISGVSFSIEDTTRLAEKAREKAVADAKARAQALAQLSGVQVGEVASISEVITGNPGPIFYDAASKAGMGGGAPIQPGQLDVGVQVQVSFAIK